MYMLMTLSFKQIERSIEVECLARELGLRLARCSDRLNGCHFTFERHAAAGAAVAACGDPTYRVTIRLSLPWAHIHADNIRHDGAGHGHLLDGLREAYANARRQLADFERTPGIPAKQPAAGASRPI